MAARKLEGVTFYCDEAAAARGEPGLWFSYMASLASVLSYLKRPVDLAWLMGASGWAFRIIVHETMCPSATSVFDWLATLPQSVEQAGYACQYLSRLWHEGDLTQQRRDEAQAAIIAAVDGGIPAISWDIAMPEWGLIVGYDTEAALYHTLDCLGREGAMPFAQLGQREIEVLSVTIVGQPDGRSRAETVRNALQIAVNHAEGGEWIERPHYENGPAAYEFWASQVAEGAGHPEGVPSAYYAGHWVGARCYARDFMAALAHEEDALRPAAASFARVAECLLPVWRAYAQHRHPPKELRAGLAASLRQAAETEREGIEKIKAYLAA